jgi:hypothetical protein
MQGAGDRSRHVTHRGDLIMQDVLMFFVLFSSLIIGGQMVPQTAKS